MAKEVGTSKTMKVFHSLTGMEFDLYFGIQENQLRIPKQVSDMIRSAV